MAKPRPVKGIGPDRRLRPNARKILAVRIEEIYDFDGLIADPTHMRELHDMRIAFKRLRYLLEIFGIAFEEDLEPFVEEVKAMQDILGDIHDRDVQVPMLRDHLEWLEEREQLAVRRAVAEATAERAATPRRRRRPSEAEFAAFRERLEIGLRADERIGVHALLARRRQERNELFHRFLDEWRRLKRERFRRRLEAALGISRG
jgi:hypothetical protein